MNTEEVKTKRKPIVAISIGDLNGVGPEVTLKAIDQKEYLEFFTPVIFASSKLITQYKKSLNIKSQFNFINSIEHIKPHTINVLNLWNEEVKIEPGLPTAISGKYALMSLEAASRAVEEGGADVLVTAPVDKKNIEQHLPNFTGHTGYLEKKWKAPALMFLVTEDLKVALLTHHIPISEVSDNITQQSIIKKVKDLNHTLKIDFGITKPKIALLGLNPHAGDNGLLGSEEENIIKPAITELFEKESILAFGPYPADSFFQEDNLKKFDAVLAMYHDQGLVAFKTLAFHDGVNFSAGLPYVRTSPDHGVAYAIAGKNEADPTSMRNAIYTAIDIYKTRIENRILHQNPLESQAKKMRKKAGDIEE